MPLNGPNICTQNHGSEGQTFGPFFSLAIANREQLAKKDGQLSNADTYYLYTGYLHQCTTSVNTGKAKSVTISPHRKDSQESFFYAYPLTHAKTESVIFSASGDDKSVNVYFTKN